jgi:hypothetical protein
VGEGNRMGETGEAGRSELRLRKPRRNPHAGDVFGVLIPFVFSGMNKAGSAPCVIHKSLGSRAGTGEQRQAFLEELNEEAS